MDSFLLLLFLQPGVTLSVKAKRDDNVDEDFLWRGEE